MSQYSAYIMQFFANSFITSVPTMATELRKHFQLGLKNQWADDTSMSECFYGFLWLFVKGKLIETKLFTLYTLDL